MGPAFLLKEVVDDLADAVESHKMDPMGPFGHARRLGAPHVVKTELSGLKNPRIHSCDGAQLPSEADFAGKSDSWRDGSVLLARQNRRADGEVKGGVVDAKASGYVQKDIFASEVEPTALFKYREQHVEAARIKSGAAALGRAINGGGHEGLNFDEQWTQAFGGDSDGGTAEALTPLAQKPR